MGNTSAVEAREYDPFVDKETERGESKDQGIRFAVSGMQGRRETMEDQHLFATTIPICVRSKHPQLGWRGVSCWAGEESESATSSMTRDFLNDHSLFAVFDGHGGSFTSKYLKDNFLDVLSKRAEMRKYFSLPKENRSNAYGLQLLKKGLSRAFLQLDAQLLRHQQIRNANLQQDALVSAFNEKISSSTVQQNLIGIKSEGHALFEAHVGELTDAKPDRGRKKTRVCDPSSNERRGRGRSATRKGKTKRSRTRSRSTRARERSGSTALVLLVSPTHIVCANTGDSRAVLRRNGSTLPLSFDHKPSNVPERQRIVAADGHVQRRRVDGDLAVSRALGDFHFKVDPNLPVGAQKIVATPDVMVYRRDYEHDEFLLLACDGVWDVVDNAECSNRVQDYLIAGELDLGNICEEIVDGCFDMRSRDNMTLMIVTLPGAKLDDNNLPTTTNALWGERTTGKLRRSAADKQSREGKQKAPQDYYLCGS
jgi:serine/threonine protein phosphatase PrpC